MSCRKKAMDYLARREHCRAELTVKLLAKDYESDEVCETLDQLEADDLVSDERFAEAYLSARVNRGFGPQKISNELTQKGVSDSLIQQALETSDSDWVSLASQQQKKKFGKLPVDFIEKAKQARFLQYRGFTFEQISQVLKI